MGAGKGDMVGYLPYVPRLIMVIDWGTVWGRNPIGTPGRLTTNNIPELS